MDHRPLVGLTRLREAMSSYAFEVKWIPGKNNLIMDTFSHYPSGAAPPLKVASMVLDNTSIINKLKSADASCPIYSQIRMLPVYHQDPDFSATLYTLPYWSLQRNNPHPSTWSRCLERQAASLSQWFSHPQTGSPNAWVDSQRHHHCHRPCPPDVPCLPWQWLHRLPELMLPPDGLQLIIFCFCYLFCFFAFMQLLCGTTLGRCGCHCWHHDPSRSLLASGRGGRVLVLPCSSLDRPVHLGPCTWTQSSISAGILIMSSLRNILSSPSPFTEVGDPTIISGLFHYTYECSIGFFSIFKCFS